MQSKSQIYFLQNGLRKGKHQRKTEEQQILQESRSVLQKYLKNDLAK